MAYSAADAALDRFTALQDATDDDLVALSEAWPSEACTACNLALSWGDHVTDAGLHAVAQRISRLTSGCGAQLSLRDVILRNDSRAGGVTDAGVGALLQAAATMEQRATLVVLMFNNCPQL